MFNNTIDRKRKSEKLTKQEATAFKKWVASQPTKIDAAAVLNISRTSLHLVQNSESGRPETIAKIRAVLNEKTHA